MTDHTKTPDNATKAQPSGERKHETESALGVIFTQYECPHCFQVIEFEGDTKGELLVCSHCRNIFYGR